MVTSASGSILCQLGIVQYLFKLGGDSFELNFIVCQRLTRPMILGLDFMHKHQIGLIWSGTRNGLLTLENKVLVETVHICETGPQLMTYSSLTLPPRPLAVLNVHVDLKGNSTEHTCEVKPNRFLMDQYPYIIIIPVIHITPMPTYSIIPFIIINLLTESIFLSKCEVLGFLDQTDPEICEIMTSLALESLVLEVTAEQPGNQLHYREGQFICSPADISVHRKVDLQDVDVSDGSF